MFTFKLTTRQEFKKRFAAAENFLILKLQKYYKNSLATIKTDKLSF